MVMVEIITGMQILDHQFQTENCEVYQRFQAYLKIDKSNIKNYRDIPFLPIQFFKSQEIICKGENAQFIFTSSTTTGSVQSKHLVSDIHLYEESFIRSFELFYGNINKYCILALLPNYYEREGSSLVYMVNHLIEKSKENGLVLVPEREVRSQYNSDKEDVGR